MLKVKSTFLFKLNTLFSDKMDLLVSPIFWNTFSVFEYHFDIQSWKIWNGVSSSELQNDRNTIPNLNNILLKNKMLFHSLYLQILR